MSKQPLTQIERVVLKLVARQRSYAPAPGHGNTMRSLERKRLIEHTSTGWRLTEAGYKTLEEQA